MKIRFLSGYDKFKNLVEIMAKTEKKQLSKNNNLANPQIKQIYEKTSDYKKGKKL